MSRGDCPVRGGSLREDHRCGAPSDHDRLRRSVANGLVLATMSVGLVAVVQPVAAHAADRALVAGVVYVDPWAPPIRDGVVLIRDGTITAVGPSATTQIPKGTVLERLGDGVLVAGFWNSHVHLVTPILLRASESSNEAVSAELARLFLRWGFTTVFDLASTMRTASVIRARIATGAVFGPNILTVGDPFYPANGTPIYARNFYRRFGLPSAEVGTEKQSAERVNEQASAGADGVKIFTGAIVGGPEAVRIMPPKQVRAIVAAARSRRLRVFAHPTDAAGLTVAVESGVEILAHSAPLASTTWTALVRNMVARRMALVPTLSLFEVQPHADTPVDAAVEQLRAFSAEGGEVLFGTDAGFTDDADTSSEVRLMSRALSWRQILATLTTNPARRFGQQAVRGRVAPGMVADLVLLTSDPAIDVSVFASVSRVWKAGRPMPVSRGPTTVTRRSDDSTSAALRWLRSAATSSWPAMASQAAKRRTESPTTLRKVIAS